MISLCETYQQVQRSVGKNHVQRNANRFTCSPYIWKHGLSLLIKLQVTQANNAKDRTATEVNWSIYFSSGAYIKWFLVLICIKIHKDASFSLNVCRIIETGDLGNTEFILGEQFNIRTPYSAAKGQTNEEIKNKIRATASILYRHWKAWYLGCVQNSSALILKPMLKTEFPKWFESWKYLTAKPSDFSAFNQKQKD